MRPHPDRLLPAEPGVRAIARRLYAEVAGLPILSPHGHVEARLVADDDPLPDPATLLITPDHYVTRLLHANGVGLDELGVGARPDEASARSAWRSFCANWPVFAGTPERGIGLAYVMGPTGGYLLGYLPAAALCGWLAERGWDRSIMKTAFAMLAGNVVIHTFGLAWLGAVIGWDKPVLALGLFPFALGDLTKLALAALILPLAWQLVGTRPELRRK